jgi:hypothetical protein
MPDTLQYNGSSNGFKLESSITKDTNQQSHALVETQKLLDGAILAAWNDSPPIEEQPLPALTAARWVWRLAGSYHTTHSTPALLRRVAERFVSTGQWNLAQWASEKAVEEQGHDQLALLDIRAMGYDPMTVVNQFIPSAAKELVNYFSMQVEAADPIGVLGYSHTLERLAMRVSSSTIQNIESILPKTVDATRCLRIHSSFGADADHVKENVEFISRFSLSEQHSIAISCYETAKMCFTPPQEGHISELELQHCLRSKDPLAEIDRIPFSLTKSSPRKVSNMEPQQRLYLQNITKQLDYLLRTQLQNGFPNGVDDSF